MNNPQILPYHKINAGAELKLKCEFERPNRMIATSSFLRLVVNYWWWTLVAYASDAAMYMQTALSFWVVMESKVKSFGRTQTQTNLQFMRFLVIGHFWPLHSWCGLITSYVIAFDRTVMLSLSNEVVVKSVIKSTSIGLRTRKHNPI